MPKVSVIVPVFNKERFIADTLRSISNQTIQDLQCILVDDGSTDNSIKIIQEFIVDNPKFLLIKRPKNRNKGASTCRNIGLENSNTDYIQFLDADDTLSEDKIEQQVAFMERDSSIDVTTCQWGRLNNIERELYKDFNSYNDFESIPDFLNSLAVSKGYFPLHAYLICKRIIDRAGPWNELLQIKNDGEFMMRVIANCKKIKFVPGPVAWYRYADGDNLSRSTKKEALDKAVYGWKLTEAYLAIHFGDAHEEFLEWSKNQLFVLLKNTSPQLIDKHKEFFKFQIKRRTYMSRLKNKLKSL